MWTQKTFVRKCGSVAAEGVRPPRGVVWDGDKVQAEKEPTGEWGLRQEPGEQIVSENGMQDGALKREGVLGSCPFWVLILWPGVEGWCKE